jgi:hypothetical protein
MNPNPCWAGLCEEFGAWVKRVRRNQCQPYRQHNLSIPVRALPTAQGRWPPDFWRLIEVALGAQSLLKALSQNLCQTALCATDSSDLHKVIHRCCESKNPPLWRMFRVCPRDNEREINACRRKFTLVFKQFYANDFPRKARRGASCAPCLFRRQTVETRMEYRLSSRQGRKYEGLSTKNVDTLKARWWRCQSQVDSTCVAPVSELVWRTQPGCNSLAARIKSGFDVLVSGAI